MRKLLLDRPPQRQAGLVAAAVLAGQALEEMVVVLGRVHPAWQHKDLHLPLAQPYLLAVVANPILEVVAGVAAVVALEVSSEVVAVMERPPFGAQEEADAQSAGLAGVKD